ncbi:hypothetical protein HYPSUDRAFT_46107 [Hypholoma sublateritium FD-334 SS-4]|uniref:Uncharacterized protein n=1 Tax=Hypholoma sublateritium (strain FD-334 SS-4) TaxID=945553 RepID=A0A0D2PBG5_HYPSF|nr:hypothetical protein HYPSUDRAFT_46107 [Hypholoma sublateritium FD-334 SS-4]
MFWTLLTAFVAAGVSSVAASTNQGPTACVSFDINWNLLAFGFNGKDYNVGTQDTWTSSGAPTDITTTGRPPFNSPNARCFLSQFTNAIYVLNADTANPTSIYIYDATAKSWSTQSVTANGFDPTDYDTILDHDTNVFYAYSNATIFSLDMQLMKVANATALPWSDVQSPDLSTDTSGTVTPGANTAGYEPTLALAQNHVHFLGVPGLPVGDAKIFVIHFSFMQPAPQNYGTFPDSHGKAASFFLDSGVQQEFAYVPDDGSATYVINVETNTTKTLTGPPTQDALASYYASTSALVQLDTAGTVAFLAYDPNTTTSGGTWSTISKIPTATAVSSSSASGSTSTGTGSSRSGTSTSTGTAASGSSTAGSNTTSAGMKMGGQSVFGAALAVVLARAALLAL